MRFFKISSFVVLALFFCLLPADVAFGALKNLNDVLSLINKASIWFLTIVSALSVFIMVWGGFNFMTSGGDSEKVKEGKDRILWGAIGLAIALLAKSITAVVESFVK